MVADKDIYAVNIYPELQHFSAIHYMYFGAVLAELQFLIQILDHINPDHGLCNLWHMSVFSHPFWPI